MLHINTPLGRSLVIVGLFVFVCAVGLFWFFSQRSNGNTAADAVQSTREQALQRVVEAAVARELDQFKPTVIEELTMRLKQNQLSPQSQSVDQRLDTLKTRLDGLIDVVDDLKTRIDTVPQTVLNEVVDRVAVDVNTLADQLQALSKQMGVQAGRLKRLDEQLIATRTQPVAIPDEANPPSTPASPPFTLQRIARWGEEVMAVFVDNTGQEQSVSLGERIKGWRVEGIQPAEGEVIVTRGTHSVRLSVGE